jgi:nitrogen regulatory protein PII-like uncharacterized protein
VRDAQISTTGKSWTASARRLVCAASASALIAGQVPLGVLSPAVAQAAIMTRADYESCQAQDETGFRRAIEALTLKGLQTGLGSVDYRGVVADEWRRMSFDEIIDKQVDVAIAEVRQETSWGRLIQSLGSAEEAQRIATAVAERTFRSEPIKNALDTLSSGMGRALAKRIELAIADTADPAQQCMQAFLGPRYGSTVARVVARNAGKEYAIDSSRAGASVSTTSVLAEGAEGLTGAVILLVRRQLANMAQRVGARMVGSVLSRVVSAVAGGVGVVLIAKDLWEFRNGVLPIVASEMKSRETKEKVQVELASAIKEQIGENLKDIAGKTAERVVEVWQEFRRAHAKVLNLADTHAAFKQFMDRVKPEALGRLDEVVGLIAAQEGDAGVIRRLENGTLDAAVNKLPAAALDIAREARSLEIGLGWAAIAGDEIGRVHELELHRRAKPDSFTKASLARLLSVGDKTAIMRLAAQTPAVRETLFELDARDLRNLGRALSEAELASLAGYLTGLDRVSGQRILRSVADTPARMQLLAGQRVRDAIVASRDQAAAVGMMLASDGVPDPWQVAEHARLVLDGRVAPILLWEKHPVFIGAAAFGLLVLLALLKRLIFGRRPAVIVERRSEAPPIRSARR